MIHIFIINHFAGSKDVAKNLRTHLAEKKGLRYFVFNTVRAGFETEIVRRIHKYFEDEKLRFYCCGGSGTMRNMLNGFDDFTNVEVAFFPCGLSNDFLKCFGDDMTAFENIDQLIDGKVVPIDYMKSNYGIAINTCSVGLDTKIVESMNALRIYDIFGSMVPYLLSFIRGILFSRPRELELFLDGEKYSNRYSEIVFGSGCVLGGMLYFSDYTDITDGIGSYVVLAGLKGARIIPLMMQFMNKDRKKMSKRVNMGQCKRIELHSLDDKPIMMNFDGELVECGNRCTVELVSQGLNFVVPQSVTVKARSLKIEEMKYGR